MPAFTLCSSLVLNYTFCVNDVTNKRPHLLCNYAISKQADFACAPRSMEDTVEGAFEGPRELLMR